VEEAYKLRGVTPIDMSFELHNRWKRLIN